MTDKMILCLLLLVLIGIIVIVVLKVMGVDLKVSGGGGGLLVIDCNLEWMRNTKECQEALNGRP
jgi:hypothetical protein